MRLDLLDGHRNDVAHGYLVADDPLLEAAGARRRRRMRERRVGGLPVECEHAVQPCLGGGGIGLQPRGRRDVGLFMSIQDGGHHFALAGQREFEVDEQVPNVRALGTVTLTGNGINRRAAEVRTEDFIAAVQVLEFESHVHGMRLPCEEHDRLLAAISPLDLREFTLFARLDQLEIAQAELILLQHFQNQAVAVVAGFDAVNRIVECRGKPVDVLEILESRVVGVRGYGERVLGALKIRTDHDHRTVGVVGFAIGLLGRHPVAEKYVDVLILQGRKRYGNRQHGDGGFVSDTVQQLADQGRGRGDVCPPYIGEANILADRRIAIGRGFGCGFSRGGGRCNQRGGGDGSQGSLDPAVARTA